MHYGMSKKAAAEVIVDISRLCSVEKKAILIELMEGFLHDQNKWVKQSAHEKLGPFIISLPKYIIKDALIEEFTMLCDKKKSSEEEMYHCAYYLPGVIFTMGEKSWSTLQSTYKALLYSKLPIIRETMAASLHELFKILPSSSHTLLFEAFEQCFTTKETLLKMLPNLYSIYHYMPTEYKETTLSKLGSIMAEHKLVWRLRSVLTVQIPALLKDTPDNKQLIMIQEKLLNDQVHDIQRKAVANLWVMFKEYSNTSPLYTYAKSKLEELGKASVGKIRNYFASTFITDSSTDCMLHLIIKLTEDKDDCVRYSCAKILRDIANPTSEVTQSLSKLANDKSLLVKSLFTKQASLEKQSYEKLLVNSLGKLELENIVKQESDIESSIKSAAQEAKSSQQNIDKLEPMEQ